MSSANNLAKLQWQCRRGMLELDLLLGDFLKQQYSQLSAVEQENFERLLKCADQDLYHWLIQHEIPTDNSTAKLIKKIIDHARHAV